MLSWTLIGWPFLTKQVKWLHIKCEKKWRGQVLTLSGHGWHMGLCKSQAVQVRVRIEPVLEPEAQHHKAH